MDHCEDGHCQQQSHTWHRGLLCVSCVFILVCVLEFVLIRLFFSIVVVFLAELVCVWWPVGRSVGLGDWRHERV